MKPLFFSLMLSVCLVQTSLAQLDYQQYFDGADTSYYSIIIELDTSSQNVWQPQKTLFNSAATAPNAILTDTVNPYPTNNISRFTAKIPLQVNWGMFALQWMQKLDMDHNFDGGIIEYSLDMGENWISVFNNPFVANFYGFNTDNVGTLPSGEVAFSGTDDQWKDVWLCFEHSWLMQFNQWDTLPIRFTFVSDSVNNNREGWMIDNMVSHTTHIHPVTEVANNEYLSVYPNPANDVVHVQTQEKKAFHLIEKMELLDPFGKVVDTWSGIPTRFWFDTNKYPNGMYFLKVRTNIKTETVPLVIYKR